MHSVTNHPSVKRLKQNITTANASIGLFALATISTAMYLRVTNHALAKKPTTTPLDYTTNPALHVHSLSFAAILIGGLIYWQTTNPDAKNRVVLRDAVVGAVLAIAILVFTDSPGSVATITDTFTIRPAVTLAATGIGIAYFVLLKTRLDWLAMNTAALGIGAPALAANARFPLTWLVGVLVITAFLDYIAVHRSDAMLTLAKSIIPFRVPIGFFALTDAPSLSAALDGDSGGYRMLGLGDVVVPGIFLVSLGNQYTILSPVVAGSLIGYVLAYVALIADPLNRDAYAGLPFLNAGVLLGALAGLFFV